ncbi:MAG: ABC transporter substrate-binding protein, partial [Lachnospiraceae bacterium]|nr:ABC transporter substrate-binding protein [Lachnospiraceae bacterium]
KDWGMQALCGTVTTTPCLAVAELSAEDNIFEVTPSASNPDVVSHDNCFQVCFTDPNQGSASAKYIGEKKLASKVAVIYNSSDSYSQGVEETFVKEAANQSFEIVVETAFTDDSKTDFSTQLQQCQDAGAELVFCPFYYDVAAVILTQADQMGYKPIFFGVDGMDGILGVENFDTKLAEGVYLLTPFAADAADERTQKFVKTYQDKYGEIPIQFAADGYDVIYVIKAAAEKANLKPDQTNEELCKALSQAMTQVSVDGLTGEGMTWAASGEVSKAPMAVIIKDGVYVSVE